MQTSPLLKHLELALPEIWELGRLRAPVEACGLLLDQPWTRSDGFRSYVKELPNRSLEPAAYAIDMEDARIVLADLLEVEEVAVWHTHPSGLLGPSVGDMRCRPDLSIPMVVIALTEDGPHPTWF